MVLHFLLHQNQPKFRPTWSREFSEAFNKLEEQRFNPSQFFIPTKEQLESCLDKTIPQHFASALYWSSTEINATDACFQNFRSMAPSSASVRRSRSVCVPSGA
jgi:hypothetical protein